MSFHLTIPPPSNIVYRILQLYLRTGCHFCIDTGVKMFLKKGGVEEVGS